MADDGDTLGLGATGCRMHAFVADPKCSVCWDLKPQWQEIYCKEVSLVNA